MNETNLNANVGLKLRQLRLKRNLKQAEIARQLEISPAYLNLIEKGKRTIPFPLLWRALQVLGEDPETFMADVGQGKVEEALGKLLDEPLLKSLEISADDLGLLSAEPKLAGTVAALFNLYKNTRSQLENVIEQVGREDGKTLHPTGDVAREYSPFDEVTDFLEENKNWFPELEDASERVRQAAKMGRYSHSEELAEVLLKQFHVRTEYKLFARGSVVRHMDKEQGVLTLSPSLTEQIRKFQIATSIGVLLLDQTGFLERAFKGRSTRHPETIKLIKINLANYVAGAMLLPYGDFFREVQRTRYDVEALASLFGVSYETVAHRLCNLSDPKRLGIPFHFIRADVAGNISKRYSATGLRFADRGGSCAKYAVHNAFLTPSIITRQFSQLPDGQTFFCFAKVQIQPVEGSVVLGTTYSIGLGTRAEDAKHLAYANGWPTSPGEIQKISVPAGISCRFCERTDCNQRASASYKFAFAFDEYTKKDCFFSPLTAPEKKDVAQKARGKSDRV